MNIRIRAVRRRPGGRWCRPQAGRERVGERPGRRKAARFATAEAIRWLEWGMRSYENFALGLAVLLFAAAVVRTARMPRPIAFLMGLSGVTYLVQGTAGSEGFSRAHLRHRVG